MLTASENVALLLQLKGLDKRSALERACDALDDVGLGKRLGHLPSELSGGEQQRVSIARAVVATPQLLLADEPTGSLDADYRDEILNLMLERLSGTPTVLVTHDPEVAARADRVVRVR